MMKLKRIVFREREEGMVMLGEKDDGDLEEIATFDHKELIQIHHYIGVVLWGLPMGPKKD